MRDDKFNVLFLNTVMRMSDEKVHKIMNLRTRDEYDYDIKVASHVPICEFPQIVHNTDSFVLSANTKILLKTYKILKTHVISAL